RQQPCHHRFHRSRTVHQSFRVTLSDLCEPYHGHRQLVRESVLHWSSFDPFKFSYSLGQIRLIWVPSSGTLSIDREALIAAARSCIIFNPRLEAFTAFRSNPVPLSLIISFR